MIKARFPVCDRTCQRGAWCSALFVVSTGREEKADETGEWRIAGRGKMEDETGERRIAGRGKMEDETGERRIAGRW